MSWKKPLRTPANLYPPVGLGTKSPQADQNDYEAEEGLRTDWRKKEIDPRTQAGLPVPGGWHLCFSLGSLWPTAGTQRRSSQEATGAGMDIHSWVGPMQCQCHSSDKVLFLPIGEEDYLKCLFKKQNNQI